MSEKNLFGRVIHKHAIEDVWNITTDFYPEKGEIIVYDIDYKHDYERYKIGDGQRLARDLPFSDKGKQDRLDPSLQTDEKTIVGAINEVFEQNLETLKYIEEVSKIKQSSLDKNLKTNNKTIVGAINEIESRKVIGRWLFKEQISLEGFEDIQLNFASNNRNFNSLKKSYAGSSTWNIGVLVYYGPIIENVYTEKSREEVGIFGGWKEENYRTIDILEDPDSERFFNWLISNAVRIGEVYQTSMDNSLTTKAKSISGAINEIVEHVGGGVAGDWYLSTTLNMDDLLPGKEYQISFTYGGVDHQVGNYIKWESGALYYGNGSPKYTGSWWDESFRRIKVTSENIDAEILAWLRKNSLERPEMQLNTESQTLSGAVNELNNKIEDIENNSGAEIVTTTGTSTAYEATVAGITELKEGVSFVMIPHITSTSDIVTLNVNNFGAKRIYRQATDGLLYSVPRIKTFFNIHLPYRVMYEGGRWILTDYPVPMATDLYGIVPVANGGVPKTSVDNAGKVLTTNASGTPEWQEPTGGEIDTSQLQTKTDESLNTTDKTVIGAINEVNIIVKGETAGLWRFNDILTIPEVLWGQSYYFPFSITTPDMGTLLFNEWYFWADGCGIKFIGEELSLDDPYAYYIGSTPETSRYGWYSGYQNVQILAEVRDLNFNEWRNENAQKMQSPKLKTVSKNVVDAINETFNATQKPQISSIYNIDTQTSEAFDISCDDGVSWSDGFAFQSEDYSSLAHGYITQKVPIAAGDNVTFTIDEGNQLVKINASESMLGEWVFNDNLSLAVFDSSMSFISNGIKFIRIVNNNSDWVSMSYIDENGDGCSAYDDAWEDEVYKTIDILEEPPSGIAAWIKANAKRKQPIGVDKVTSVDTTWYGTDNVSEEGYGIHWDDGIAFFRNEDVISTAAIHQRVPISAGENVTFSYDGESGTIKINATGGSGGSGESINLGSAIGTWKFGTIVNLHIAFEDMPMFERNPFQYNIDFTSNGETFTMISAHDDESDPIFGLYYDDDYHYYYYDSSDRGWSEGQNSSYRTIEITGGTDVENTDLIIWLNQNAVRLVEVGGGAGGGPSADDSMIGTWVFNDELSLDGYSGGTQFSFISDGVTYDSMSNRAEWIYFHYDDILVNDDGTWEDEAYKTIQILTEPTDEAFITWFKANATKQGGSNSGSGLPPFDPEEDEGKFLRIQGGVAGWFPVPNAEDNLF